jgi:hypothetical protein
MSVEGRVIRSDPDHPAVRPPATAMQVAATRRLPAIEPPEGDVLRGVICGPRVQVKQHT